ncbi:hypothetical protein DY052_07705 [Apilactobacillus timberlakei]|uniref:hypothetical protein n=1 Tax=Apilactobacillus timberlakei TaxID=2008380 RepID=UPI0011276571|nr:hypothetical protein [Apilactobacillus timberlakei]TPR13739.1 hypothetical protein DY052_07705 [Apilactobacillus timberlakei]
MKLNEKFNGYLNGKEKGISQEDSLNKTYDKTVFHRMSTPDDKDIVDENNQNNEKTKLKINKVNINEDRLDRLAYKVLKPQARMVNNFTGQLVIDALIQYSIDDPTDKEELKKQRVKFNWEIFGTKRHLAGSKLYDGNRKNITMPKYLMAALKVLIRMIKSGENNSLNRSLVKDLDINVDGKRLDLSKEMTPQAYRAYTQNVHITTSWLIVSLLFGTIKLDNSMREKIIKEISSSYDKSANEMEFLLSNNILTPATAAQTTNQGMIMFSKEFFSDYNLSLLHTAQRVFNNYDEEQLRTVLDNTVTGMDDGLVNTTLHQFANLKLSLSNRLHYALFIEK